MRSGHGRALNSCIVAVGPVPSRANTRAGSSDVGFNAVAAIDRNRTSAAKASYGISAVHERSNRVRCRIERGWSCLGAVIDAAATRTVITRCYHHLDTSSFLSFNSGSQFVARYATLRDRATPGVIRNIGRFGRVAFVRRAVQWVGCKKPLHALDVSGWGAGALVHVTATDPPCAGRHSNLVARAIVAYHRADCVAAMAEIIARLLRIVPARVAHAIMNGIMPVEVVIGVDPVPAAIMRLKHIMRPANTSVCASNHDSFPFESKRPHIRRVRIGNSRLDRRRASA
jgi:hypothetical protein